VTARALLPAVVSLSRVCPAPTTANVARRGRSRPEPAHSRGHAACVLARARDTGDYPNLEPCRVDKPDELAAWEEESTGPT